MSDAEPVAGSNPPLDFEDPAVRDELKSLTQESTQPGIYFGKGFDFTPEKRHLIEGVVQSATEKLQPFIEANQAEWDKLQALIQEGTDKGVLLSFANHAGTFVPTWCIDGGEGVSVQKVRSGDDKPQIAVPTPVFRLFDWTQTVDALDKTVKASDETLKGRTADQVGIPLGRLSHLLVPES